MTWLADLPDGDTDWERFTRLCPDAFAALAGLVTAAREETDPALLELARLRIASLLRHESELAHRWPAQQAGIDDAKLADLARWPTSPRFDGRERACLAFTEQFVIDANGITDAHVADVTRHLGPAGCYAFVQAVSALETVQRACLTLGIHTTPAPDHPTPEVRS